ncbi:MAG: PD-(D/E)XK nuclease family protein [Thermoplasmata archaeon]
MDDGPWAEGYGWRPSVSVRRRTDLEAELEHRRAGLAPWPPVAATDLVDPRPAFYRRRLPEPQDPARWPAIQWGRMLHRVAAPLLAPASQIEVNFFRDGVAGRLDGWSNGPVEIKSGAAPFVRGARAVEPHPEHLEQVAIYAGLLDARRSTLALLRTQAQRVEEVRVVELAIDDPAGIRDRLRARAERLRSALRTGDASDLPRCRWRDRGCAWQTAGRCGCTGDEPAEPDPLAALVRPDGEDTARAAEIESRCRGLAPPALEEPWGVSDLIYPRFAYFRRVRPVAESEPRGVSEPWLTLRSLTESGPLGESRVAEPSGGGTDVGLFRDHPLVLKTRTRPLPEASEAAVDAAPQYFLEAGLRCAFRGDRTAWLLVGVAGRAGPLQGVQAFEIELAQPTVFSRIARERAARLDRARVDGRPKELPACPAWRPPLCPYAPECGCPEPRSQR